MEVQEPKLSRRLRWFIGLGVWGTALLIATAGSYFAKLNFWLCLAITAAAFLVNGWVATLEDDLPGGFNNPDGKDTPRYAVITGWVVRSVLVVLVLICLLMLGCTFSVPGSDAPESAAAGSARGVVAGLRGRGGVAAGGNQLGGLVSGGSGFSGGMVMAHPTHQSMGSQGRPESTVFPCRTTRCAGSRRGSQRQPTAAIGCRVLLEQKQFSRG